MQLHSCHGNLSSTRKLGLADETVEVKFKLFVVDFHFLGISQNSLSLMVFVVLILINRLLFDRF